MVQLVFNFQLERARKSKRYRNHRKVIATDTPQLAFLWLLDYRTPIALLDDHELVALRTEEAVGEIIRRYRPLIRSAASKAQFSGETDDLERHLTYHVVRKLDRFVYRRGLILGPWMKQVLWREVITYRRRNQRHWGHAEIVEEITPTVTYEYSQYDWVKDQLINEELLYLDVLMGDTTMKDVAADLGLTPLQVSDAVDRLREKLKGMVDPNV